MTKSLRIIVVNFQVISNFASCLEFNVLGAVGEGSEKEGNGWSKYATLPHCTELNLVGILYHPVVKRLVRGLKRKLSRLQVLGETRGFLWELAGRQGPRMDDGGWAGVQGSGLRMLLTGVS